MNFHLLKLAQVSFVVCILVLLVRSQPIPSPEPMRGVGNKVVQFVENGQFKQVPFYDNSYALVIGMTDYKNGWTPLKGPKVDVEEVKNVLVEHGFNVQIEMNLTGDDLERKISQFVKKYGYDKNNRLIIYFSGHGETLTANDGRQIGYIVPIDAPSSDKKDFKLTAMGMDRIESFAKQIETKHALFVFDSCFSGQLLNATKGRIISPSISRFLEKPARQFITSGSSEQKVPDDSKFRNFFVHGLRGEADIDRDGYITASELGNYLYKQVTDSSRDTQTPQQGRIENYTFTVNDKGEMIFFLKTNQESKTQEQEFEDAKAKNTVQAWTLFLNSCEDCRFRSQAIEQLIGTVKRENQNLDSYVSTETPITRGLELKKEPFDFKSIDIKNNGDVTQTINISSEFFEEDLGNNVRLKLVKIPAGKFKMGSEETEDRKPVRDVNVTGFLMGMYEITKEQWETVAGYPQVNMKLSKYPAPDLIGEKMPIVNITWDEAKEFCDRLSAKTGRIYSLPSEAEWEYAARGGNYDTRFAFGKTLNRELVNYQSDIRSLDNQSPGIPRNQPIKVGSFEIANKYGLFDMHGNVAEWCQDGWFENYEGAPLDSSARVGKVDRKVVRGGAYNVIAQRVCSTCRNSASKDLPYKTIGFRVVVRGYTN